ncbi:MAG: hypothetical protein WA921_12395 [Ahrensia sp.]
MNDEMNSSCWGITGWALVGCLAIIAVAYVFGLNDTASVQAVASQAAS